MNDNNNILDVSYNQTITLTFSDKCATWLRGVMQNPLSDDPNPDNEDSMDREMRTDIWNALNK